MFNDVMTAYGSNVKAILGNWGNSAGMADNYSSFQAAVQAGQSPEEAAFNSFTGKMAARWGFTNAQVITDAPGKVQVLFTP